MSDRQADNGQISRRELFDRIWSTPMTTNASALGTRASALSTLARRLGLPLPRAGHWMKKEVGREPPTPDYPADPQLDEKSYPLPRPKVRNTPTRPLAPTAVELPRPPEVPVLLEAEDLLPAEGGGAVRTESSEAAQVNNVGEQRKVASTRTAIAKSHSADRASTGGRGKFRLLVAPASGARACSILDKLVATVEARGWPLDNTEKGYAIVTDGETVGLMIEEKLDRLPHIVTAAELKEKAEYDRKCALADRGIGYRPWREPPIPEHDYVPNGELVLKLDHDYDAGGTRRTFSDGKRQRLEDLIPSMIDSLERWSVAVKAKREERAEWKRNWEEQERRRKDHERQVRVEGYRITFLQRQVERKREIDGLAGLIDLWSAAEDPDTKFAELLEFACLYRKWLETKLAPDAIAKRIADLKLMDDDVYIYDAKRLD
ncbi:MULTISPECIES: hypothetical protein [unclassified Sphingobium]|uniref:hypothetical protein n=1 Tax=unclassified Sphingobium TaxID=2611147 RepID=UPI0035A67488